MGDNSPKVCSECDGTMQQIILMDRYHSNNRFTQELEYRLPDDKRSFWTGKYPTGGNVQAFMCSDCGKINLYGAGS